MYSGILSKTDGFFGTFLIALVIGEGINLFDYLIIDAIWWRNSERIRFRAIPEKEAYQDLSMHRQSFLRGIALYICTALLVALIVTHL